MELTLNGLPITVDPIAAQEIVRRHLLGDMWPLPVTGAAAAILPPRLNDGEKYAGFYMAEGGKLTHVILLPGEKKDVSWKDALSWAKDQDGDLPNRMEALLLWTNLRDEFQREVYWTNEQVAGASFCAWYQGFSHGGQGNWLKDYEFMARAVRRVAI